MKVGNSEHNFVQFCNITLAHFTKHFGLNFRTFGLKIQKQSSRKTFDLSLFLTLKCLVSADCRNHRGWMGQVQGWTGEIFFPLLGTSNLGKSTGS